jgi:DNA-binding transcriptional ArsR family regulator
MSGLIPQKPQIERPDPEKRVLDIRNEESRSVFSALSSETGRAVLEVLYDEPATQSELAERVDTSIQNVGYHLDRLIDAGLVTVAGQGYSEKGRVMDVYAPATASLVLTVREREFNTDSGHTAAAIHPAEARGQSSD